MPEAGSCLDCPKRTGHNILLFEGLHRTRTNAPIRTATPRRSMRTFSRPSRRNRSWYRSALPTERQRKAAPPFRATSTSRSARTSRPTRSSATGRSTRRASSPPRPSSPKAARRAKSGASAPIPNAPCIMPRSNSERCRRCRIQGRTGEAPPRGSPRPGNRLARP